MRAVPLYPLRFREIIRPYTFGDRWIPGEFPAKTGLPDGRIAETWEVCDRPGESSVVTNGALEGRTLHELIEQYGVRLMGTRVMDRFAGRFPLQIKFLDATHVLGEQAHHDDVLAKKRGLSDPGKTEAWYMLRVKEGSTIRCGSAAGVHVADLRQAVLDGTSRECMQVHTVRPGDAFLLYAGTMHYSAGGQLFYEIMQNSDVFIGLGKPQESLDEAERQTAAAVAVEGVVVEEGADHHTTPLALEEHGARRVIVLACEHFALERLELNGTYAFADDPTKFSVLTQVAGNSLVKWGRRHEQLRPGNTCLLPASLESVTIEGAEGSTVLRAYVPDLVVDIVRPLRAQGIDARTVAALGGHTKQNPLASLLDVQA